MKSFAFIFLISLFFCSGCDLRKREDALQKREADLQQREQELNLKANTLQIKEQELIRREQKLDSAITTDTAGLYNPAVVGTWLVKMICTQTSCTGSAIGDTKTEQWIISYEGNSVVAKAMVGDKLIRIYTGKVTGNNIQLQENIENQSASDTKMLVTLSIVNTDNMKGTRELIRTDECKVIYDLQMDKKKQ